MLIRGAVLDQRGAAAPYAESRPLRITELQLDDPGPDEVLVRITAAGVCHSDLSVIDGNRPRPTPMLLGHEAAGIVEATGENVTDLEPGEQVVAVFLPRCGECAHCRTDGKLPCIPGTESNNAGYLLGAGTTTRIHEGDRPVYHHIGVSCFATHAVMHRKSLVPVSADVPAGSAAVLGCAVLTGGGAVINAAQPGPGEDIMIVGLGGVGMAALLVALSEGSGSVIGVDANPEKLQRARELGAHQAYTPDELAAQGIRAPVVIECAGHPKAFETAFEATAVGGRTVTIGLPHPDARSAISPTTITGEARTIIGCYLGSSVPERDIPRYAQAWREGRLPVEKLITAEMPLEEINEAMDTLARGEAVRQIIRP